LRGEDAEVKAERLERKLTNAFTIADAMHEDIIEMEGQEGAKVEECREDPPNAGGGMVGNEEDSNLTYVD